jgi:hypothetical protein
MISLFVYSYLILPRLPVSIIKCRRICQNCQSCKDRVHVKSLVAENRQSHVLKLSELNLLLATVVLTL